MFGLFDELFDLNHNGMLDGFEKAAEYATMVSLLDETEAEDSYEDPEDEFDWSI